MGISTPKINYFSINNNIIWPIKIKFTNQKDKMDKLPLGFTLMDKEPIYVSKNSKVFKGIFKEKKAVLKVIFYWFNIKSCTQMTFHQK
jgi:hypothetical protein